MLWKTIHSRRVKTNSKKSNYVKCEKALEKVPQNVDMIMSV